MKKTILIGFIILLNPIFLRSQIQVAFKGGYNYYWIINSNQKDSHDQTNSEPAHNSFGIGFLIKDQTNKTFNPGLEIEYLWRSFKINNHWSGLAGQIDSRNEFEVGYLNIYIKPGFSFGSKWKVIINTGLYFSFLVNSHVNGSRNSWIMGMNGDATNEGSAHKYFNTNDLGIMSGIGLEVPVSKKLKILLENNYSLGLLNISKSNENGNLYNFFNVKFTVGLAYRIENAHLVNKKNK